MKIVMVAGYFDPIHEGHIDHIRKAKELGGYLIVSVASEEDCIRKKGYCFQTSKTRQIIVSALKWVDVVLESLPSNGNQVATLIKIQPDIFAKGGDRTPDNMSQEEIDICQKLGIEIRYGIGDLLNSSSKLVEAVRK